MTTQRNLEAFGTPPGREASRRGVFSIRSWLAAACAGALQPRVAVCRSSRDDRVRGWHSALAARTRLQPRERRNKLNFQQLPIDGNTNHLSLGISPLDAILFTSEVPAGDNPAPIGRGFVNPAKHKLIVAKQVRHIPRYPALVYQDIAIPGCVSTPSGKRQARSQSLSPSRFPQRGEQ